MSPVAPRPRDRVHCAKMTAVEFECVPRDRRSFQRPLTAMQVEAMCGRLLGSEVVPVRAVENEFGTYNSTYRVEFAESEPVFLRVAPSEDLQLRSERHFMRNEHAGFPYLAPIAGMLPRYLGADFTHAIVDRDYVVQSELPGRPAPLGLADFPRDEWEPFFRDMGTIAKAIHEVRGERFGPLVGQSFDTWGGAFLASLDEIAADHVRLGLESQDVGVLSDAVIHNLELLNQVAEPRLLHGDLWTVNVTIANDLPRPRIVGVCDWDRISWGDPLADWTIRMAKRRQGTERDAFWEAYGSPDATPEAAVRALIYEARHVLTSRIERFRLGLHDEVAASYRDLGEVLGQLPK